MNDSREDLAEGIGLLRSLISSPIQGNSKVEFHINAGGMGVWVAATCCLIMLAVLVVSGLIAGLWVTREFTRIDVTMSERKEENDRAQTYLSSIFGRVPELKKQIDQESEKQKKGGDGSR